MDIRHSGGELARRKFNEGVRAEASPSRRPPIAGSFSAGASASAVGSSGALSTVPRRDNTPPLTVQRHLGNCPPLYTFLQGVTERLALIDGESQELIEIKLVGNSILYKTTRRAQEERMQEKWRKE